MESGNEELVTISRMDEQGTLTTMAAELNLSTVVEAGKGCPPNIPGTSGAIGCVDGNLRLPLTIFFSVLTVMGFLTNGLLVGYIVINRLYRNYVSSHFIAHLSLTNMLACAYLIPVFIYNFYHHSYDYYPEETSSSSSETTTFPPSGIPPTMVPILIGGSPPSTTISPENQDSPPTNQGLPASSSPSPPTSSSTTTQSAYYHYYEDPVPDHLYVDYGPLCRIHAFLTCAIWSVICYMTTCVAGVHLLTFARIHYDQLFGLPPTVICLLSWVIGASLGLPCLTNLDIVKYDPLYMHCLWGYTVNGYKFLAYIVLLGVVLPCMMTLYSYIRVLGILFHSPIVFQALGLYKSRYLVYILVLMALNQAPFYITRNLYDLPPLTAPLTMFLAYFMCILDPLLYGVSLFLMKEEDMALTARAHAATRSALSSAPPHPLSQHHHQGMVGAGGLGGGSPGELPNHPGLLTVPMENV